jgi:hypothetical protein
MEQKASTDSRSHTLQSSSHLLNKSPSIAYCNVFRLGSCFFPANSHVLVIIVSSTTTSLVWITQSKGEAQSLIKPRQTSISLYKKHHLCHIRNPKRLPTANIELHPKSEPVATQQNFAPELFNAYTYVSYFIFTIFQ